MHGKRSLASPLSLEVPSTEVAQQRMGLFPSLAANQNVCTSPDVEMFLSTQELKEQRGLKTNFVEQFSSSDNKKHKIGGTAVIGTDNTVRKLYRDSALQQQKHFGNDHDKASSSLDLVTHQEIAPRAQMMKGSLKRSLYETSRRSSHSLSDLIQTQLPLRVAEQKFIIVEISPQWCFADEVTKVIIIGTFKCDPSESVYAMFGDIAVEAQIIQNGVLSCHASPNSPGKVSFCITSGSRESCSEVKDFEYRDRNSTLSSNYAKLQEQLQQQDGRLEEGKLLVDFVEMLSVDSSLQELLEDKLQQWLRTRFEKADNKSSCTLSQKERGIIHIVAGLGYHWALNTILDAGVGVNFRDTNGWTALHWAARFGREEMVVALIACGASVSAVTDPTAQDPMGKKNAAAIADANGHKGLAAYLSASALNRQFSDLAIEKKDVISSRTSNESVDEDRSCMKRILEVSGEAAEGKQHALQEREVAAAKTQLVGTTVFKKMNVAAATIQKYFKGWKQRTYFLKMGKQVIKIEDENPMSFIFLLLPEDYEIEKDTLIQLWMAAEYIYDEQDGKDHFTSYFKTGYLLYCGSNFLTGNDRYRINAQMINELRVRQKDKASCYLRWNKDCMNMNIPSQSILHFSLDCSAETDTNTIETLGKFTQLRTLLFLGNRRHRLIRMPSHLFSSLRELRTLDLSRTLIQEIPSSIGDMIHLRYLDFSWTLIEWLPDVLCSLGQLQTLKLRGCSNLRVLPEQLNQLTNLRHLDVDALRQLEIMPKGIGALVHLRTFPAFLVGTEDGFKIQEMGKLNKLSGKLCIAKLENVVDETEAVSADLCGKKYLEKLELRWTEAELISGGAHQNSEAILECLQPWISLEELQVFCYEGARFPDWISDPRYNRLVHIVFYRCERVLELPPLEKLPFLKHLELVRMNSVERIELQSEHVAFPELETLEINEMKSLKVWDWKKRNEGDFERLAQLIIDSCPELEEFDVLPHLSKIKCFEMRECVKLQFLSNAKLPDTLEELTVEDCPRIQKRCEEEEGVDWNYIKHVPTISIEKVEDDEDEDMMT